MVPFGSSQQDGCQPGGAHVCAMELSLRAEVKAPHPSGAAQAFAAPVTFTCSWGRVSLSVLPTERVEPKEGSKEKGAKSLPGHNGKPQPASKQPESNKRPSAD